MICLLAKSSLRNNAIVQRIAKANTKVYSKAGNGASDQINPSNRYSWPSEKRQIANKEEMLSMTKYLFAGKSDLARGFEAVRHFNIRKFKTESNHILVLKH